MVDDERRTAPHLGEAVLLEDSLRRDVLNVRVSDRELRSTRCRVLKGDLNGFRRKASPSSGGNKAVPELDGSCLVWRTEEAEPANGNTIRPTPDEVHTEVGYRFWSHSEGAEWVQFISKRVLGMPVVTSTLIARENAASQLW